MQIAVVVFDGFETLDAIGPFEVFRHASRSGAAIDVGLYTLEPQDVVTSSNGLEVIPDGVLPRLTAEHETPSETRAERLEWIPDMVLVPGGGWNEPTAPGTCGEVERGTLPDRLAGLHEAGATMTSVCTGAMLLAAAGITEGRPAVTHRSALSDLADTGATVVESRVVDDGDVVTAGGITAGFDLAFHVLEREFGTDVAGSVAETMEYDRGGSVYEG